MVDVNDHWKYGMVPFAFRFKGADLNDEYTRLTTAFAVTGEQFVAGMA
jgi:hypothetical protein